ncbi:exo-alpha-sialidase [Microlunatus elymi]|uniref:Exo-alpha-sialidase n=1 Tax=Microlunatus elymi TaxID=2596828 RepID=A0A516PZJ1_9ACTN|nr:sialidase family protein [Microlunatus elymi]QDP96599.1 exo-alpha-sialidase [Microlunatus elymi]
MLLSRTTVYREPGRLAGWPANYGLWRWDDEVVAMFAVGWLGIDSGLHPRDKSRPFAPVLARSLDGGLSWNHEPFTGAIPTGAATLSGDEHVEPRLQIGPRLDHDHLAGPIDPIDFTDPELITLCARTGIEAGARSWFYTSTDRARSWQGPYRIPMLGTTAMSARTDIIPLGRHEALFQLTCGKADGSEGRVLCAWTGDGGRTLHRRSWVGDEPEGFAIMPSSVLLDDGVIITARRCAGPDHEGRWSHWIDVFASHDHGSRWVPRSTPVPDTGRGGNPPALVKPAAGRLVLIYGHRAMPYGIRAVISDDHGRSWSAPQVLIDDLGDPDLGYPRALAMADGSILIVYYASQGSDSERYIESIRWRP